MKVLDLQCLNGHVFEGWFGSEDDYQDQTARGLLTCPVCAEGTVTRLPSAPRLNLSGAKAEPRSPSASSASSATSASGAPAAQQRATPGAAPAANQPVQAALQALWLQAVQQVLATTEDVGPQFAEEARRIHYGESEERGIRGQTTPEERAALADEGIEVVSLPLPAALKGPVQ
jgi:hypothetical protein